MVETAIYANNSLLQRTVISMVKPILEESIEKLCDTNLPECLKIGDFGCSAGSNTLLVVSHIIDKVQKMCPKLNQPPPQFQVFLNDLPGNDFNTLFRLLPDFYQKLNKDEEKSAVSCFIVGVPGSFYGKLFPDNSLHFAHSSYAIIWLSKVPEDLVSQTGEDVNKGYITITKQSPPAVHKAYFKQYKKDFSIFLRCRAQELVTNGSMVLLINGSFKSYDPQTIYEFVGLKLKDMVEEGLVEEEKLDSFNLPYYTATPEDVKEVVEAEGSFTLQKLEAFTMDWDAHIKMADSSLNKQ